MKTSEVVVIGGGAAGCATAYYLSKEGLKVTLVDKDAIGSHASGFAFGGLNYYWIYHWAYETGAGVPGNLLGPSMEAYRQHGILFKELMESTGVDTYYREGTELNLAFKEEEIELIKGDIEWQQRESLKAEFVDREDLHDIEPRINPDIIGGSLMNDVASVEAYRYVLALLQASERMGATQQHGNVMGIKRNGSRPSAVVLDSGEIPCDVVVIAMGPWSGAASEWLDFPVPVEPVRGQILRLQFDEPPLACPMNYLDTYAGSKASDGLVWCGTTFERVGFDESTTTEARASLLEGAIRLVPALENAQLVLQTACLRPFSSDELPIIGQVPGWEGVYLATAAGAEGILLSPFFGQRITDLIIREKSEWDLSTFLPDRFATKKTS